MIRRGSITIPRGQLIQVNVKGAMLEDEKLFTNSRKLITFLNFINKYHKKSKIVMKSRRLN